MNKLKPTHKISFWGVRCYFDEGTGALWGINPFFERLIPVAVSFHNAMTFMAETFFRQSMYPGFRFKVLEEYQAGPETLGHKTNKEEERDDRNEAGVCQDEERP